MTPKDTDYMNRYIYQVIRRLPKAQQEEVSMELEELISDMYADKGSMEKVLTELGDPAEFAKQYQNRQMYLIGPEYYDTYLWFVKVVLICSTVSILAVSIFGVFREVYTDSSRSIISMIVYAIARGMAIGITEALGAGISAFGFITLIFIFNERQKIKIDVKRASKWSVDELQGEHKSRSIIWKPGYLDPVPDKGAIISRSDSIITIVFIIILCVLLIVSPDLFGFYVNVDDSMSVIPIFNLEQWGTIMPLFVFSLLLGLADEVLRLIIGVYNRTVMISNIVCGAVQIILSVVVLKILPFWNPDIITEFNSVAAKSDLSPGLLDNWNPNVASNIILIFIVGITLLEIGVTVYKTLKYKIQ